MLSKVPIPFIGGGGASKAEDPLVPFNAQTTLGYGHTLDFTVYHGLRSPSKLYSGSVMVDEKGILDLGKVGKIKVGGLSAYDAVKRIETAFRRKHDETLIQVHLHKIEDVPLITVTGAVRKPAVIQWFDDVDVNKVLPYVGGRDLKSEGQAVYVTHKGVRKFHANSNAGDKIIPLQPGDIVHFSGDL